MGFTTIHPTAIFEEDFILVGVDFEDIQDFGEKEVFEAIQNHDWILEQDIPVVIVYEDDDDKMCAYGDSELVEAVTQMAYDDIIWGHELSLDWDDDDFEIIDDDDDDDFDDFDDFDDDLVDYDDAYDDDDDDDNDYDDDYDDDDDY